MSKDWTLKELELASQEMQQHGFMAYAEFCEALSSGDIVAIPVPSPTKQLQPEETD